MLGRIFYRKNYVSLRSKSKRTSTEIKGKYHNFGRYLFNFINKVLSTINYEKLFSVSIKAKT